MNLFNKTPPTMEGKIVDDNNNVQYVMNPLGSRRYNISHVVFLDLPVIGDESPSSDYVECICKTFYSYFTTKGITHNDSKTHIIM